MRRQRVAPSAGEAGGAFCFTPRRRSASSRAPTPVLRSTATVDDPHDADEVGVESKVDAIWEPEHPGTAKRVSHQRKSLRMSPDPAHRFIDGQEKAPGGVCRARTIPLESLSQLRFGDGTEDELPHLSEALTEVGEHRFPGAPGGRVCLHFSDAPVQLNGELW